MAQSIYELYDHVVSPTQIKQLEECPRSYHLDHIQKKRKFTEPEMFQTGKLVHSVMERLATDVFDGVLQVITDEVILSALEDEQNKRKTPATAAAYARAAKALLGAKKRMDFTHIIYAEQHFVIELGDGFAIQGYIDRIDEFKNRMLIRAYDYKLAGPVKSRSELESDPQVLLYLAACKHDWPDHDIEIVFWFVEPDIQITVRYTDELRDIGLSMARATAKKRASAKADEEWQATLCDRCSWCPHADTCEALKISTDIKTELDEATDDNIAALVKARQEMASVAKAADARKKEIDKALRPILDERGEIIASGFKVTMTKRRNDSYPNLESTIRVLTNTLGVEPVATDLITVSKTKVKAFVKQAVDGDKDKLKEVEEALSEVASHDASLFPKFTKVKSVF